MNTCDVCGTFVVGLRNGGSGRTIWVPAARFFPNMALSYAHALHGRPHYHPGGIFLRESTPNSPRRAPRRTPKRPITEFLGT